MNRNMLMKLAVSGFVLGVTTTGCAAPGKVAAGPRTRLGPRTAQGRRRSGRGGRGADGRQGGGGRGGAGRLATDPAQALAADGWFVDRLDLKLTEDVEFPEMIACMERVVDQWRAEALEHAAESGEECRLDEAIIRVRRLRTGAHQSVREFIWNAEVEV